MARWSRVRNRHSSPSAGAGAHHHAPEGATNDLDLDGTGCEVVSVLDSRGVAAARRIFDDLAVPEDRPWYVSSRDQADGRGRRVDVALKFEVGLTLRERFPDHHLVFASFCSKGRRSPEPVSFHHDVTFTDERSFRSLLLWCPLVDCGPDGGALQVLPGSHRWFSGIRPSTPSSVPQVTSESQEDLVARAVGYELRAGDGILIDAAMVHGSAANATDRVRPAVTFCLVPRNAPVLHFHQDEQGRLGGWAVDDEFFTSHDLSLRPEGFRRVEPWTAAITVADVRAALVRTPAADVGTIRR